MSAPSDIADSGSAGTGAPWTGVGAGRPRGTGGAAGHPVAAGKVTQARVIASEWVKLRSLRSTWYTLAVAVVGMAGLGILFAWVTESRWATARPEERAGFNPAELSLRGMFLAQLAIGVLGVLIVSSEYASGMIRATLAAVPKRLPVLIGKALVFAVLVFTTMLASAFIAFFGAQSFLSRQHIQTTVGAPGVLRIIIGTALYLTVVGLLAMALGWLIRNTAGAIATVFGLLLVLPVLGAILPASWGRHITPYLPSNAGQDLLSMHTQAPDLRPWVGFSLFCAYTALAFLVAAALLRRRDA